MKIQKNTIYISFILFLTSSIIGYFFEKTIPSNFLYSLILTISSSSFVALFITIPQYLNNKKILLENYRDEVNKIINSVKDIEYLKFDAPIELIKNYYKEQTKIDAYNQYINNPAKEELINYYKEKIKLDIITTQKKQDDQINEFARNKAIFMINLYDENLIKIVKQYFEISKLDLSKIIYYYNDISLLNIRSSLYNFITNDIHKKIIEYIHLIKNHSYTLNDFINNEITKKYEVLDILILLQSNTFEYENYNLNGVDFKKSYNKMYMDLCNNNEKLNSKIYKYKYKPIIFSPSQELT